MNNKQRAEIIAKRIQLADPEEPIDYEGPFKDSWIRYVTTIEKALDEAEQRGVNRVIENYKGPIDKLTSQFDKLTNQYLKTCKRILDE